MKPPCIPQSSFKCLGNAEENIPVKLIVDGAAGRLMQEGQINKVIIGADRVAKMELPIK